MKYKAVLFDFDYTLGDATDSILAGFTHAFTEMGLEVPSDEIIRDTIGMVLEDAYHGITGDSDPAHHAEFRRLFIEVSRPMQLAGVPLFPGAKKLITALHDKHIPMAIISSKRTDVLEGIIATHGLSEAIPLIIGSDKVSQPKPNPEGILSALSTLGIEAKDALYCGDTMIDAQAAHEAKVSFCPVINGVTPPEAFAPYPWAHMCRNLTALQAFLGV